MNVSGSAAAPVGLQDLTDASVPCLGPPLALFAAGVGVRELKPGPYALVLPLKSHPAVFIMFDDCNLFDPQL